MKITFVTESHLAGDEKSSVDVLTHEEFNNGIVCTHGKKLQDQERKIRDISGSLRELDEFRRKHLEWSDRNSVWINDYVNPAVEKINRLDHSLHDVMCQVVSDVFKDKLDCFAKQVEELREERKQISVQLEKLRKERQETQAQLNALRSQCTEARAQLEKLTEQLSEAKKFEDKMNDDFSMQVAEFKMQVPVPKKFAKFLFMKKEPAAKEED